MSELIALIIILAILWPVLKFIFKLTFWAIALTLAAVAVLWVLFVMGGCAAIMLL